MKKFLAILLIAAIAGSFIDELKEAGLFDERDDVVLEGLPDFFRRLWDKIKQIWNNIPGAIQKVIDFLKKNGYWNTLIDLIEKYGTKYATDFCAKYLERGLCADAIQWIFNLLESLK